MEREITFEKPKTVILRSESGTVSSTYSEVKRILISKLTFTTFYYIYNSNGYMGHMTRYLDKGNISIWNNECIDTYL
jgi:hypothetical protein